MQQEKATGNRFSPELLPKYNVVEAARFHPVTTNGIAARLPTVPRVCSFRRRRQLKAEVVLFGKRTWTRSTGAATERRRLVFSSAPPTFPRQGLSGAIFCRRGEEFAASLRATSAPWNATRSLNPFSKASLSLRLCTFNPRFDFEALFKTVSFENQLTWILRAGRPTVVVRIGIEHFTVRILPSRIAATQCEWPQFGRCVVGY